MSSSRQSLRGRISRRRFLELCTAAGAAAQIAFAPPAFGLDAPKHSLPAFEQIPASSSGISWRHVNGRSPMAHLPETVGPGCGFLDYDNDGWMDIYLVNSGPCDFFQPAKPLSNALYHNNRDGTFTDVTAKAGVPGNAYGMGVAVGDYDGDGFPDLYVTQYPRSILYHNNGDGTFSDVTAKAGVDAPGGLPARCGLIMTTTGALIFLFAASWTIAKRSSSSAATGQPANGTIAFPRSTIPCPAGCFTIMETARLPTSARKAESPPPWPRPGEWLLPT